MGHFKIYTVIIAIISFGCGSEERNVKKKGSKDDHESTASPLFQHEDVHCIVNFPEAYVSDTLKSDTFSRISHSYKSDSLHVALEEINYNIKKDSPTDSLFLGIHEAAVKSLVKRNRILDIDFSEAQKSLESVGKINGHDESGNYTFLRYQVKKEGIIQVAIWADSAHVSDGEDILNALKFK